MDRSLFRPGKFGRAAFGFRAHSGWAALTVATVAAGTVSVLGRHRIELIERDRPKQPFHAAEGLPLKQAEAIVRRSVECARRLAYAALRAAITDLEITRLYGDREWSAEKRCPAFTGAGGNPRVARSHPHRRGRTIPRSTLTRERSMRPAGNQRERTRGVCARFDNSGNRGRRVEAPPDGARKATGPTLARRPKAGDRCSVARPELTAFIVSFAPML